MTQVPIRLWHTSSLQGSVQLVIFKPGFFLRLSHWDKHSTTNVSGILSDVFFPKYWKDKSITVSFNITFSGKSTTSICVCSVYSTIHSWGRVETLFYGYVCIECDARKIISQSSCEMRRMLLYRSIVLLTSKPSSSLLQPLLISFNVLLLFYYILYFLFCN